MAFHAAFLQNGGDVLRVSDLAALRLVPDPADETAWSFRRFLAYLFAAQQFVEGLNQVAMRGPGPREADAVLVVDAAPVADHAVFIEHEHLGRAQRPELVGQHVSHIFQNWEGDVVDRGIVINGARGVL